MGSFFLNFLDVFRRKKFPEKKIYTPPKETLLQKQKYNKNYSVYAISLGTAIMKF